jgi:hypothetical protein
MKAVIFIPLLIAMAGWVAFVWLIARLANNDRLLMRIFVFIERVRVLLLILASVIVIGFLLYEFAPQIKSAIASATRPASTPTPAPTATPAVKPPASPSVSPPASPTASPEVSPTASQTVTPTPFVEPTAGPDNTTQVVNSNTTPPPPVPVGRSSRREERPMILGSTALEVAIGMIFVYLLMSLLCSAVAEYIEAKLNYRSKDLEKGIRLLLDQKVPEKVSTGKVGEDVNSLAARLYEHPLVKSLYRGEKLPSYIPARTFALALWDMAVPAEQRAGDAGGPQNLAAVRAAVSANAFIGEDLKKALLMLMDDAEGDFEKARKNVEDWYDGTMDRVSGWYKRRVHVILLFIGLLVSAAVNADSINIARALMSEDGLRAAIVGQAEKAAATPLPSPTPTPPDPAAQDKAALQKIEGVRAQLDATGLPVGWVSTAGVTDQNDPRLKDPRRFPDDVVGWLLKVLGILITALAVSQGAPFWFDLLNKFIVIRSTVKPQEKSQPEGSKDKKKEDGKQ